MVWTLYVFYDKLFSTFTNENAAESAESDVDSTIIFEFDIGGGMWRSKDEGHMLSSRKMYSEMMRVVQEKGNGLDIGIESVR